MIDTSTETVKRLCAGSGFQGHTAALVNMCCALAAERDALEAEVERVRAEERERCARIAESRITGNGIKNGRDLECEAIASAIREGGE